MVRITVQSTASGKAGHLGLLALSLAGKENGTILDLVCLPSVEGLIIAMEVRQRSTKFVMQVAALVRAGHLYIVLFLFHSAASQLMGIGQTGKAGRNALLHAAQAFVNV
jgi:hypothetical protein